MNRYEVADRWLPPRWRWLLGDDAMLHERDLRAVERRNVARMAGKKKTQSHVYEALRRKGVSKQRAAKISNGKRRGGKKR